MTQHVSGTIVPIFRSARLYTTAYGFQHLKCWQESWHAGRLVVCTVYGLFVNVTIIKLKYAYF